MSKFESIIKRGLDFILSGFLLLFFSPLFLICFIALKIGDKGPAVYRQERIGLNGKPFNILKFRSMRIDAEAFGPALYSGDDDPRLTKIGKFLRLHHLDELPQLWNVFRGDMSFIGYRPERQFYIDQIMEIDSRYRFLYQIRPGVTSYATLYNGYTDTLDKMIRRMEYDLFYLRNRSLLFDAKILWITFAGIVFGKKF
ncbi:MAG: sugar transferase [Candidatus Cryptobacteroides sp.]